MADEETSTVAESVSTSASAEPVEAAETVEQETAADTPATAEEAWDFSNVEDEPPPSEATEEKSAEKSEGEEQEKQEEKKEEGEEKSLEELTLEEAFKDDAVGDKTTAPSEKEADLDKLDPAEMIAAQRNATARAWAERNAKKAEIVKDFQFEDKPIAEVASRLEEINPTRYVELSQLAAHRLVDSNPDAAFQRAYAVKMLQQNPKWDVASATLPTLDDLIANGTKAKEKVPETKAPAPPAELAEVTRELDNQLGWDWRDPSLDENFVDERELAMAKTLRALEQRAAADVAENRSLNEKLEGLSTTQQSAEQEEIKAELQKVVKDYRDEIEKKVLPYAFKNTGLEISASDTPEMKAFKENRMLLYKGTGYERANNLSSAFESFAYNESSVRNELETITTRVVAAQLKEVQAKRAGDKAGADKHHREAQDEMVPMFQLFGQANKEFKELYIAPDMALIGKLSSQLSEPIKEASERVEVVSNGSQPGAMKPRKKDLPTADAVWDDMVESAREEDKLRANA